MINWFPGHMKKTYDILEKYKDNIDFVIQVIDSRAITYSFNNELINTINNKIILTISLKTDISDVKINDYRDILFLSKNMQGIRKKVSSELEKILVNKNEFNYFNPTHSGIVVGLPNIGKSTLINKMSGYNKATVMNLPGTTKKITIQKITDKLFIYDSPGLMYKKIQDIVSGYVLCLIGTISKKVVPLYDVLKFGLFFLKKYYNSLYLNIFKKEIKNFDDELFFLARKWNLINNNEPNYEIVLNKLYDMFVDGSIGKISYDNKDLFSLIE